MTNKVDVDNYTENYNQLLKDGTRFFSSSEEYFAKYKVNLIRKQIHALVSQILKYGCGIGRDIFFPQQIFPDAFVMGSGVADVSPGTAQRRKELRDCYWIQALKR